jgi:hypothetical protein
MIDMCLLWVVRSHLPSSQTLHPMSSTKSTKSTTRRLFLFRMPKDLPLAELNGAEINLDDLKIVSGPHLSSVTDLQMNRERASACPLVEDDTGKLRCGSPFEGIVHIVRKSSSVQPEIKKKDKKKKRKTEE